MRALLLSAVTLVAACDRGAESLAPAASPSTPSSDNRSAAATSKPQTQSWDLQSSGEGTALALVDSAGGTILRIYCAAGAKELLVNVPSFRPIGSEERLTFGAGGEAVALVADTRGDRQRGGVSGTGPVPDNLLDIVSGRTSVSYGSQVSGPHPAPPAAHAQALVQACGEGAAGRKSEPAPRGQPAPQPAHPCNAQDNKPLPPIRLKAIGTEPFWGARIEGRCVTYSHPDDQKGTRVWARFSGSADQGSWTGSLFGKPFILRTRPQAGCSDGMSDRRYPIAVNLTVSGEQRQGCADRL